MWISLTSFESTVATLSNKQLSTNCLFSVSILPGKAIDISQFNRIFVVVTNKIILTVEIFTTRTTDKPLKSECYSWWSSTAFALQKHIRHSPFYTFMTTYMPLKTTTEAEFLMTNVIREPSSFIVAFSRCAMRRWCCLKQSEQCLHKYGFAPVWV